MAIVRKKVTAAQTSTSTHFPNLEKKTAEDSGQEMLNHQEANTLIDPEEDEGGNTHFLNEEKDTKETRRMNASISAAAKRKGPPHVPSKGAGPVLERKKKEAEEKKKKAEAAFDEDMFSGEDPDSGVEAHDMEEDPQALPNEEDPAEGYLTVGEF